MTAVQGLEGDRTIAVALAQEPEILRAVSAARERGLANSILIGGEAEIRAVAEEIGLELEGFAIVDEPDPARAAARAVELVRTGRADILMKGMVGTATLLRAVLDKERGLRSENILSHVAVFEPPGYGRLFLLTDAAMNIAPDLQRKAEIIRNAALIANSWGLKDQRLPQFAPSSWSIQRCRQPLTPPFCPKWPSGASFPAWKSMDPWPWTMLCPMKPPSGRVSSALLPARQTSCWYPALKWAMSSTRPCTISVPE